MAVEVMSKRLQKHAVLVSLVVAGFTFIAVALAGTAVSKALLARVIDIEPGKNGLGHISSELPSNDKPLGSAAAQAGQDINRSIILQEAAESN